MHEQVESRSGGGGGAHVPPTEALHGHAPAIVAIWINNHEHRISRGRHAVVELKRLDHIPACDELSEVVHGVPRPLAQEGYTHIEGGERFLSSPGSCSSS